MNEHWHQFFFFFFSENYEDQNYHQHVDRQLYLDIVSKRHQMEVLVKSLKKTKYFLVICQNDCYLYKTYDLVKVFNN